MGFVGSLVDLVFSLFRRNKAPQLQDPQQFDTGGLRFEYPRNWKVTDEDDDCYEDLTV